MASFSEAYKLLLPLEGGYVNIASDRGGETYAGISRKYFPKWTGWDIVDKSKPLKKGQIINNPSLDQMKSRFYENTFWNPIKGNSIVSQNVANFIFDWYVNSGSSAVIRIQRALGLTPDGLIGKLTIDKINGYGPSLIAALKVERIDFVNDIIKNDPSQEIFRKGWMNRIHSFN